MKRLKLVARIIVVILILLFSVVTPIYAIGNPDSIDIGWYSVFYDVLESNDMLFVAEGKVIYAIEPTDYSADEAFLFEVLDTAGTSTLASTTLQDYGDRPIAIYLSATRVTELGLTTGTAYKMRITGNPLIFASQTDNTTTLTLASGDYIDQDLGEDGGIPTANNLRNFLVQMAIDIEAYDTPTDDYITTVAGFKYLTISGGDIFLEGIPALADMCPILFQAGIEAMTQDTPETTGTYASTLNPAGKWGQTVANGLTALGTYLGISQSLAGSVVLFIIAIAFAVFIYQKTESGITVLLMISATPFLGAYLGLMPLALAFILVIFVVVLLGYFFFSRGAL